MIRKKALCLVMVISFLLGISSTALAAENSLNSTVSEVNTKITKDKAKEIAVKVFRDLYQIEIGEKNFQSTVTQRNDYGTPNIHVWDLSWSFRNNDGNLDIGATIDGDTGRVIGIRRYEFKNGMQSLKAASITEDNAQKLAEDFIYAINPDARNNIKYIDESAFRNQYAGNGANTYSFRFNRIVNGVEYINNTLYVEVNGIDGKINNYNGRWDDNLKFPAQEGIIDKTKADEKYKNETKFRLMYLPVRNPYDYGEPPKEIKAVYTPNADDYKVIDAKSGEMIMPYPSSISEMKIKDLTAAEREELNKKSVPLIKPDGEMNRDTAETRIKSMLKDLNCDGYEIQNLSFSENQGIYETRGKKAWTAQIQKLDSNGMGEGGQLIIDALTGQLISFNKYQYVTYTEKFEPKITWDVAYNRAIEEIVKFFPDKVMNINTEQKYLKYKNYVNDKEVQEQIYYFTFPRIVNGISYGENNINIEFDIKTGTIRGLRCAWDDDVKFPELKNIIGEKDASKAYFEYYSPELAYMMINKSSDPTKPDAEVKLTYVLNSEYNYQYGATYIDAVSGKMLNYYGENISIGGDNFKEKIKGNVKEKELSILAYQGILDTKTFELNKEATKFDVIRMLVYAKGYNPYLASQIEKLKFSNISESDSNYKLLQLAVRYGLLENTTGNFNGDEKITREDLAKIIIKASNYDKLATAKDIFVLKYRDTDKISIDKIGYVAIARGLGIMDGLNDEFRPKDNASMLELADAIYKSLEYIKAAIN